MLTTPLLLATLFAVQAPQAVPGTTAALGQAYFLFIQGRMLEGQGDTDGAVASYHQALGLAPKSADIHAELAGLYARQGNGRLALSEGQAALAVDPDNVEAHRILGYVQAALADAAPPDQQGQLINDATAHMERALSGGMRDPGAELTLGRLYVRSGQVPKGHRHAQ